MNKIHSSKIISLMCYGITVLIFIIIVIQGLFLPAGDEMGYSLFSFYLMMPLTSLIASFIISMKRGYLYRFYPVFVGFCGLITPFAVFRTFDEITLFFTLFPALIGLILGKNIGIKMKKNEEDKIV